MIAFSVADSATALAKKHGIFCYLCPNSDHNSWCPEQPGQHGYIFVGLGKEKDTFITPTILNVFVGTKSPGQSKPVFKYLGLYRVSRVEALTVEEWLSLPLKVSMIRLPSCLLNHDRYTDQGNVFGDH